MKPKMSHLPNASGIFLTFNLDKRVLVRVEFDANLHVVERIFSRCAKSG